MNKKDSFKSLLYSIILLVLINLLGSYINFNYDLTAEKRHTISDISEEILLNLDDIIYVKIFLKGEYPSGFKRLEKSTREILEKFKDISGNRFNFVFINPSESDSEEERNKVYQQLIDLGLKPTDLQVKEKDGMSSSIIFPGAILYYKEKNIALELLKNEVGLSPQLALNKSIEMLEYEFISAISKLTRKKKESIAFLSGHNELDNIEVADICYSVMQNNFSLSEYYDIEHFDITKFEIDSNSNQPDIARQLDKLKSYKVIIIAKPSKPFNNLEKLLIDQYIMSGGNILWLLDGVNADMDSLNTKDGYFIANNNNLNLNDMLFVYGARINSDLIQDKRAAEIPIITGYSGNTPQQSFFSWPYYPLLLSISEHNISKGLDAIKCEFVSSIDTIQNNIKKEILLQSSNKSRVVPSPQRISLGILKNIPKEEYFNSPNIPIALLLEGEFKSVFRNRIQSKNNNIEFKEKSKNAKMIIVSDGDIIRNDFSEKTGNIYPLGYDKFGKFVYPGNKNFIINCIHYLSDNMKDLILSPIKTKKIKLRLLDKEKVQKNRDFIQLINIFIPIILIISFGLIYRYNKRKKYA